jgi:phage tail sheath protein FI
MTPGVYIEELNAFPGSAVAVETAVPVFIGYTETAIRNGKSLVGVPTPISSFAEYAESFGGPFIPKFKIGLVAAPAGGAGAASSDGGAAAPAGGGTAAPAADSVTINGKAYTITLNDNNTAYFYNSIRLFYANGGANCYIYSVGTYGTTPAGFEIKGADFIGGSTEHPLSVFDVLLKEYEPTLIVMPDIIALGAAAYDVYTQVLMHCAKAQSRMGIFDLRKQARTEKMDDVVQEFRDKIQTTSLNYGAAYYPWLKTSIVQPTEVDFGNIDPSIDLASLLPDTEGPAKSIVASFKANDKNTDPSVKQNYHQSLKAASPTYATILDILRERMNELPPSAAMAGIYTLVDSTRGVWKAPANVSVSMVNAPSINVSSDEQQKLNVDVMAGKSINVIRPFPGIGTLVWGARTLDGNSQDWRYINVRRTLIMIEQSLKLATRAYVFEPNDAGTWITVKSMFNNFLVNLWKQGALAGAVPEQAFDVQIGLGATMTPTDVLDGVMKITVKLAIVRPAEFIVITFQQQQQVS